MPLKFAATLGDMLAHDAEVQMICNKCGSWKRYSGEKLQPFVELLGLNGTLWDRFPPCEEGDCDGLCWFRASPRGSIQYTIMKSDPMMSLPVQSMMDRWFGLEEWEFTAPGRRSQERIRQSPEPDA